MRPLAWLSLALASSMPLAMPARAADAAPHPWIVNEPGVPRKPSAYFVNLRDGARITTPFVVKFGLRRYGLAPAGHEVARAGHHHLLIDRDLPLDFSKPLPFDSQYIHFGMGQMETELQLPPGRYTLRLLLADQGHIPLFVYSKPVTVTVTGRTAPLPVLTSKTAAGTRAPEVALLAPRAGEAVKAPFLVQAHASGLNVAAARVADAQFGHFRVLMERDGHRAEAVDLADGSTEVWLKPPPGSYRITMQFVNNGNGLIAAASAPAAVQVQPPP